MQDMVVLQNLRNMGANLDDMNTMLRYEAPERKPRVLDSAPKRVTLSRAKEIAQFGCQEDLVMTFRTILEDLTGVVYSLDVKGLQRLCDRRVYGLLQALILHGYTKSKARAEACFEVFKAIVMCKCDTLTIERIYEVLHNYSTEDYYTNQVVNGALRCLLQDDDTRVECYWRSIAEYNGYYLPVIQYGADVLKKNCKTEKDVQKFLGGLYKEAKADKDFLNAIYKPGVNKYMMAMLYYLKDEHPELLEPSKSNIGFA